MKRLLPLPLYALLISLLFSSCGYNTMVTQQEAVDGEWAQVNAAYQQRNDLIGNLVETVKGYANFEQETLIKVTEARASATQVKVDASQLTEEGIQKYQAAQGQLTSALSKLLSITENYPNLKADQGFSDLRAELSGQENRILVARRKFNDAVKEYNTTIQTFPNNMMSGMFGFKKKGYFEAEAGAEKAVKVKF
ncbi:LemA family protein [uncultured Cytophaga sp.]|uniref:LemA family protein n=1 Tax=uncultured Cytophaga sp. TaxID=160238 RepID=UPI00261DF95E|nr:LemA family protein [uncultured Cytophaga sp.]